MFSDFIPRVFIKFDGVGHVRAMAHVWRSQ